MLILDLWGISFHSKNILFKSFLGYCDSNNRSIFRNKEPNDVIEEGPNITIPPPLTKKVGVGVVISSRIFFAIDFLLQVHNWLHLN